MNFSFIPIFLVVLVDLLGMMMMVPMLPFYAEKFGASPFEIGLLGSAFTFFQFLSCPVLGHYSDRYGRKPLLMISQIGTLLGLVLMIYAQSLWVLFIARIIDGITAGNISLAQAYVADHSSPENRAKAFGMLGLALGIGLLTGPALSGILAAQNLLYPIYLAAILSFLSILTSAFLLKSEKKRTVATAPFSFLPGIESLSLRPWLIRFFIFVFAFGFFSNGLALFLEKNFYTPKGTAFGPKEVGYLFSYCGLLGIIIQGGLIGRLVRKYGEEKLVRTGFVLDAIGYILLVVPGSLVTLILGSTFFSTGNSLLRPALTSLITRKSDPHQQGAVLGLTSSLQSIAHTLAAPLGGVFLQNKAGVWPLPLTLICLFPFFLGRKNSSIQIVEIKTGDPQKTNHREHTESQEPGFKEATI